LKEKNKIFKIKKKGNEVGDFEKMYKII
jgi:hypothetical protein